MATALDRSRWPDLPLDLLGLVLSRTPSHADRVRLRAVCSPWRSGARMLQPLLPPLLPWAALRDGTFVSLPDGVVHRLHVPDDVCHRFSTGSLLLLVHRDGRCSLMHPQSGDLTPQWINPEFLHWSRKVPMHVRADNIRKVVLVSDRIVAVRTIYAEHKNICLYSRGADRTMDIEWIGPPRHASDIALFQGKLYLLTSSTAQRHNELHVLDVTGAEEEKDGIRSVQCIRSTPAPRPDDVPGWHQTVTVCFYLVASGDRLLIVEEMIYGTFFTQTPRLRQFEVFEAVDLSSGHGRWSKIDTLMGHALFVSADCSESILVGGGVGSPQEDCIYFMSDEYPFGSLKNKGFVCGVYNIRQGTTMMLLPSAMPRNGPWSPTWFFPDRA